MKVLIKSASYKYFKGAIRHQLLNSIRSVLERVTKVSGNNHVKDTLVGKWTLAPKGCDGLVYGAMLLPWEAKV
jgi:hypothetical protein